MPRRRSSDDGRLLNIALSRLEEQGHEMHGRGEAFVCHKCLHNYSYNNEFDNKEWYEPLAFITVLVSGC